MSSQYNHYKLLHARSQYNQYELIAFIFDINVTILLY